VGICMEIGDYRHRDPAEVRARLAADSDTL
jgi:hypothetical protein